MRNTTHVRNRTEMLSSALKYINTHEHRAINLLETSDFWSVKFFFFYENVITTEQTTEKEEN
jgi:hypothetical protein